MIKCQTGSRGPWVGGEGVWPEGRLPPGKSHRRSSLELGLQGRSPSRGERALQAWDRVRRAQGQWGPEWAGRARFICILARCFLAQAQREETDRHLRVFSRCGATWGPAPHPNVPLTQQAETTEGQQEGCSSLWRPRSASLTGGLRRAHRWLQDWRLR